MFYSKKLSNLFFKFYLMGVLLFISIIANDILTKGIKFLEHNTLFYLVYFSIFALFMTFLGISLWIVDYHTKSCDDIILDQE